MQYKTILRLLGLLLMIFSPSMLTPLIINYIFQENFAYPFLSAFSCTMLTGLGLWLCFKKNQTELKIRDGFLLVVLFWLVICFFASIPLILSINTIDFFANSAWSSQQRLLASITDAIFETVSGITTTGASVINHLDKLPKALLFYRQQLQFVGGIGIVILAVAILPMLGFGGMQLFQAEIPGPMKNNKLTPRITQTAKAIWSIYLFLTFSCAISYYFAGMSWFDALGESFGTVSTGGFALHDTSFAYYNNQYIEIFACLFMFLGGTNFSLHFIAIKKLGLDGYRADEEFRFYLGLILFVALIICLTLLAKHPLDFDINLIIKSFFTSISLITTTGLEVNVTDKWQNFTPFLGLLLMIIGGCAASTSGGVKILRILLIFKQSSREIAKILHPQAIIPIKLGKKSVSDATIQSVWGFISIFIGLYLVFLLIFMWLGHDLEQSFAMVTATLTNSGFGLGNLKAEFARYDNFSKDLLIMIMLVGRLEIFTILILFTKDYWRG